MPDLRNNIKNVEAGWSLTDFGLITVILQIPEKSFCRLPKRYPKALKHSNLESIYTAIPCPFLSLYIKCLYRMLLF